MMLLCDVKKQSKIKVTKKVLCKFDIANDVKRNIK